MRDAVGFDQFYRDTRQRVLQYLVGVSGGDLAEAQDAAAEAYARAWQRWDRVRGCDDPEAWVRVVAWRILASGWRKLRGRRAAYTRHGPAPAPPEPGVDGVALMAALRTLPIDQRIAIVLYHIIELPVAAIAEQTGVPVGTVKARLARARRALAPLLSTTDDEEAERAEETGHV
jgi:RNA polymerase sigma factor (sigma-70 family)